MTDQRTVIGRRYPTHELIHEYRSRKRLTHADRMLWVWREESLEFCRTTPCI